MKKVLFTAAALFGLGLSAASAGDEDSLEACKQFAANNGVSAEPCSCIADAVSGDADLKAEQLALQTMDDYENASDELHAALDSCISG